VTVDLGATCTVDALASALSGVMITGSGGLDTLVITDSGTVNLSDVSGFPTVKLASTGANTLTLTNANFVGVTGGSITVYGGNDGNTVNAAGLTGANRVIVAGGAGKDIFKFTAAALTASDTVTGGAGNNELLMTTAGTVAAGGATAVEVYQLANGGANSLTLANANFTGVTGSSIMVYGGNAGNTVNASALTGANRVIVWGGAGKDAFTGGAGDDIFKFTAAALTASDTVTGEAGTNYLEMTTAGTVAAGGVRGVEVTTSPMAGPTV